MYTYAVHAHTGRERESTFVELVLLTCYVVEGDLELLIILPPSPEGLDYRCAPPCPGSVVLGIEPSSVHTRQTLPTELHPQFHTISFKGYLFTGESSSGLERAPGVLGPADADCSLTHSFVTGIYQTDGQHV